jgi:hypothetical protein
MLSAEGGPDGQRIALASQAATVPVLSNPRGANTTRITQGALRDPGLWSITPSA